MCIMIDCIKNFEIVDVCLLCVLSSVVLHCGSVVHMLQYSVMYCVSDIIDM